MTRAPGGEREAWTARRVKAALYRHFTARYAVITELTITDPAVRGVSIRDWDGSPAERRVDVLLLKPDDRMAVEVKVTRADFLADLANPAKHAAWRAVTHRFAFAAPEGLIDPTELPADTGLIVVGAGELPRWAKRVKPRPALPLPPRIERTIHIRCAAAEARMKGLHWAAPDVADPGALRARVADLESQLSAAENRASRNAERATQWRRRFALHTPPPCGFCGRGVVPDYSRRTYTGGDGWRHRNPDDDAACEPLRPVIYGQRRESIWPDISAEDAS